MKVEQKIGLFRWTKGLFERIWYSLHWAYLVKPSRPVCLPAYGPYFSLPQISSDPRKWETWGQATIDCDETSHNPSPRTRGCGATNLIRHISAVFFIIAISIIIIIIINNPPPCSRGWGATKLMFDLKRVKNMDKQTWDFPPVAGYMK